MSIKPITQRSVWVFNENILVQLVHTVPDIIKFTYYHCASIDYSVPQGKNGISLYRIGTRRLHEMPYGRHISLCLNFHEIPTFWIHFLVQDRKAQG